MKKTILTLLICFLSFLSAQSQELACYHFDKKGSTRPLVIDQSHLKLEISLDTLNKKVLGKAIIDFTLKRFKVDTLHVDAPNMKIKELRINGKKASYTQNEQQLAIAITKLTQEKEHKLLIEYETQPKKGLYFVGWDSESTERNQIWTQGQGIDNRHWIPHVDAQNDKLTSEIVLSFNSKYEVISNGTLLEQKKLPNGITEWHYHLKKPHASYLIMLAIGEFKKKTYTSKSGIPLTNYYYPDREDAYEYTYRYTKEAFDWLEDELGVPYVWGSYKQVPVKDFLYGGMENTGATIFNDSYHSDASELRGLGYLRVNIHEMAHQWFGNYITSYAGKDHWLHEGFATYYEFLVEAALLGEDVATLERLDALKSVIASPPNKPVANSEAGNLGHYQKGALVLHLLRETIGPENYRRAITHYLNQFGEQNVVTQDFENAIHQATGYVLDTFFYQWVHQPILPLVAYEVDILNSDKQNYIRIITHQNEGESNTFFMPTEFVYSYGKKETSFKLELRQNTDTFLIPVKSKELPNWYTLDPDRILPISIVSNQKADGLIEVITSAKSLGAQWQAIQELKQTESYPSNEALNKLFNAKLNDEIFAQCIGALVRNDTLPKIIINEIRERINIPLAERLLDARWKADSSNYDVLEAMLALPNMSVKDGALWSLFSVNETELSSYLEETSQYANRDYGVFPVSYAFLQLIAGNRAYGPVLYDYLRPQHDLIRRQQAIEIFDLMKAPNQEIIELILEAAIHFNSRMRSPAKRFISNAYSDPKRKANVVSAIEKISKNELEVQQYYNKLGLDSAPNEVE